MGEEEYVHRRSMWWRRTRGTVSIVGEILGFCTAVLTALMMVRVAIEVESAFRSFRKHLLGDESIAEHHCREQLEYYRAYYCVGLGMAIPLSLVSIVVPVALCKAAMDSRGFCKGVRHVMDELGYYQSIDENV